jgi:hypothetical protein
LAAIPVESAAGLRLRALVLAYLLTGRRRSEVLNLRWRDLDLEGGFYRYSGKGGKERQRALPPPVRLAILVYAEAAGLARKPEKAVFPGRWRDQPVDGKYIGEELRQAAELAASLSLSANLPDASGPGTISALLSCASGSTYRGPLPVVLTGALRVAELDVAPTASCQATSASARTASSARPTAIIRSEKPTGLAVCSFDNGRIGEHSWGVSVAETRTIPATIVTGAVRGSGRCFGIDCPGPDQSWRVLRCQTGRCLGIGGPGSVRALRALKC